MTEYNTTWLWTIFGAVVIILIVVAGIMYFEPDSFCKTHNFDKVYSFTDKKAAPGFVLCCNKQYENNIQIPDDCKAVKRTNRGS